MIRRGIGFFKNNWQILVLIAIAAIFRFVFLGLRPFDGDEGVVIKMAQAANLHQLFANVANDVHPPLFHLLEFISLKVFSVNGFTARLLSAIAGILAIWPIYKVFEKLENYSNVLNLPAGKAGNLRIDTRANYAKIVAGAVAVLSVFSAVLSYHAAEVRPYALLTLIFFAQFYFFLRILEKRSLLLTCNFILSTFLLILTQYIGLIILAGEILYIILLRRKALTWQNVTAGILSVVLFAFLWGRAFLHQLAGRRVEQDQLISFKANIVGVFNAIYRFGAGRLFLDLDLSISKNLDFAKSSPLLFIIFVLSVIVPLVLLILGMRAVYLKNHQTFWLIIIVLLPLILAALVSSEIGPRAPRYFSFLAPFYLYFIVSGVLAINKKFRKYTLAGIFVAIFLAAFVNGIYFERKRPGVNKIAEYLIQDAKPNDALVIMGGYGGGESWVANYYLGPKAQELRIVDLYGDYKVGNLRDVKSRDPIGQIESAEGGNTGVWFYDLTYSVDQSRLAALNPEKINLGKDKENKELVLYKVGKE